MLNSRAEKTLQPNAVLVLKSKKRDTRQANLAKVWNEKKLDEDAENVET
jgi:hypothetical protein